MSVATKPDSWAIHALKCVCEGRPELSRHVKDAAARASGIEKAALLSCTQDGEQDAFAGLHELLKMPKSARQRERVYMLRDVELNWLGREDLLIELLRLHDANLAFALLIRGRIDVTFDERQIGPVQPWLDWLSNRPASENAYWIRSRVGEVLARTVAPFLAEFNRPSTEFRPFLARFVLGKAADLTTDNFSPDAIAFLLSELERPAQSDPSAESLLGKTATESFVAERLLPVLPRARHSLRRNLLAVLRAAGERHGRRYIPDEPATIKPPRKGRAGAPP
jgi:hypothetical protein